MNPGTRGEASQKQCKKGKAKMKARSDKSSGLNLTPLAPAKSKHIWIRSVKTRNSRKMKTAQLLLSVLFCMLFLTVSTKIVKPAPEHNKNTKMESEGSRTEHKDLKITSEVPRNIKNTLTCPPRSANKWSPRCYDGVPGTHQSSRKTQIGLPKC